MTKDIYPIIIKPPMFNLSKIIAIIFGVIILILWYKTCHPDKLPVLQPVVSIADQKAVVIHDSIVSKRLNDSAIKEINKYMMIAMDAENTRDEIATQNLKIQDQMDAAITQPVPDTCKAVVAQISTLNSKLKQSAIDAQKACNSQVNAQKGIIKNKDGIIAVNNTQINNLRASVQTALDQQRKLQDNIKKLKPRSSIGVGVMTEAAWAVPYKFDAGAFLYFRNKMGSQVSIGIYQSQRIQLSYSKQIAKF